MDLHYSVKKSLTKLKNQLKANVLKFKGGFYIIFIYFRKVIQSSFNVVHCRGT